MSRGVVFGRFAAVDPMPSNAHFILGRAGGGKSHAVQQRVVALLADDPLGPPVYLLVPAQATFVHERHYALSAGLAGYARLRVVGFDDLARDLTDRAGGAARREVTAAGRQMLVGHLLRKNADRLSFFRGVARQVGLVREIDRTFAEFERAGKSSAELLESFEGEDAPPPQFAALREKTRDLALIGDAYAKVLGEDRTDAGRRLAAVLGDVERCKDLAGAHLFVDGFDRFTTYERLLIARLAKCVAGTTVALTIDPDHPCVANADHLPPEGDLFEQTANAYRGLMAAFRRENVKIGPPTLLRTQRRLAGPIALIERDWDKPRPSKSVGEVPDGVRLIEAPDARAEADAAARQMKDWLNQGYRLREVAVLCRDLPASQALLEASLREHGVTFFVDRRRPAAHHPLVRFVRSLLAVANNNWPHEAIMDLCKCGLAGMSLDDADALENYVLECRIRGRSAWTRPEPWTFRSRPLADVDDEDGLPPLDESAERVEPLRRRLVDAIAPLTRAVKGEDRPAGEFLSTLWSCVEAFGVAERLGDQIEAAEAAGELEEASENRQAWEQLCGLLDQADDLIGREVVSGGDFVATVEYGLDLLDFAVVPPRADEAILGDVERTRLIGCRAAVVVGLNDGVFPAASNDDGGVLGDEERRLLRGRGVDVEADGRGRLLAERFLAYRAFSTPSERLTLVRSVADAGGEATTASPYWQHVQHLLGTEVESVPRDGCDGEVSCLGTPRGVVSTLLRWARRDADERPINDVAGLYDALARRDQSGDDLTKLCDSAWPALSYKNEADLSPDVVAALYGDALSTSVSRLESFAACPFKHFAAHVLKLRGRDEDDVTPRDLGVVYHGVLQSLVERVVRDRLDFAKLDAEALNTLLPEMTRVVGEELRGQIMLSTGRNRYLLDRVRRTLEEVVAGQKAAMGFGSFAPFAAEVAFGRGGDNGGGTNLPPLEWRTPGKRVVRLHGQIDRVDTTRDGHAAIVIDYKLGGRRKPPELKLADVHHGLSLQLPMYLIALEEHGRLLAAPGRPAPTPVAGLYVKLARGIDKCDDLADAPECGTAEFDLRVKPRGLIDRDHLPQLDGGFLEGGELVPHKSEAFYAALNKTGKDDDGLPAPAKGCDVLRPDDFTALLAHVRRVAAELADRVLNGEITVWPYRVGATSPCSRCDFRSVCRFDPRVDDYRFLEKVEPGEFFAEADA